MNLPRRIWFVLRVAIADILEHMAHHIDPEVHCEHALGGRIVGPNDIARRRKGN